MIISIAASTSSASPTTSTSSPSSARMPDRRRAWSSTRKTRGTLDPLTVGGVDGEGSAPPRCLHPIVLRTAPFPPTRCIRSMIERAMP